MASNPATPFGIEFRHVEDPHDDTSASDGPTAQTSTHAASLPRSAFSRTMQAGPAGSESPFAALSARHGRPLRVAILSDFTRIPYANGAAFQTRFLYQELRRCGHEVTVIGPDDPDAAPGEMPPNTVGLPSLPLKTYPGLRLPMPIQKWVYDPSRWNFDICFAQATSLSLHFGVWLRKMKGIPLLCVNTTHLAAAYDVLLPENAKRLGWVNAGLELALKRPCESHFAKIYNDSDRTTRPSESL